MPSPFHFVAAIHEAHFEAFKTLLHEYASHDLDDACHSTIWSDLAQLPGRYAPPSGLALLAYQGQSLAGCGAFVAASTWGMAEIKRVYVRPTFRRQGLARMLTQALLARAQQSAYQTAAICTWPHNTQALALYQNLGFTPIPSFREPDKAHLTFLGLPLVPTAPPRH